MVSANAVAAVAGPAVDVCGSCLLRLRCHGGGGDVVDGGKVDVAVMAISLAVAMVLSKTVGDSLGLRFRVGCVSVAAVKLVMAAMSVVLVMSVVVTEKAVVAVAAFAASGSWFLQLWHLCNCGSNSEKARIRAGIFCLVPISIGLLPSRPPEEISLCVSYVW